MGIMRVLVTSPEGLPVIRDVPDDSSLDHLDVSEVLGLAGGETVRLLSIEVGDVGDVQTPAPPPVARRIQITDLDP